MVYLIADYLPNCLMKSVPFGDHEIVEFAHDSGSSIQVIPSFGGALHSLKLIKENEEISLLRTSSDPNYFNKILKPGYNGSFLAPFPNRLSNGKYNWTEKEFQFPHNDFGRTNALHGSVYDQQFNVTQSNNDNTLNLEFDYQGTFNYYPFPFHITQIFELHPSKLVIRTKVDNTGHEQIPYGIGWHPYFDIGKKVDELILEIPADKYYEVDDLYIPTSLSTESRFQKAERIANTKLDTCYKVSKTKNSTTVFDEDRNMELKIVLGEGYDYLQYYIPEDRMSIAIEPMTCAPNAFNNGDGLIMLEAGSSLEREFCIEIS